MPSVHIARVTVALLHSWRAAALIGAPKAGFRLQKEVVPIVDAPVEGEGALHRETLNNYYDVSYTGIIDIGGEEVQTIFDTGSFELVVLSQDCKQCGTKLTRLYDSNQSNTYQEGNLTASCTYGSGTAYTQASYDDVSIGAMQGVAQFFWKVYEADTSLRSLFQEDSFGAILGCGPSASVEAFAAFELQSVHKEYKQYAASGGIVDSKVNSIIKTYEEKLALARATRTTFDNLRIRHMSVCFGKESKSPGYFIWNDDSTIKTPELFLEVPVVGDFYWSAELTDVQLGAFGSEVTSSLSLPNDFAGAHQLGCFQARCSAVIDTGTTLISAPASAAFAVDDILYDWENNGGDCRDLSKLPNLEFKLGGKSFMLPPEAYVAQYTGTSASLEQLKDTLPGLYKRHTTRMNETGDDTYSYCASLLSPMSANSQFGPLWIMGMSFFRAYYSSFFLEPDGETLRGASMFFSIPNADCTPSSHPYTDQQLFMDKGSKRKAQLHVDLSKIRGSALANRVRNIMVPKIPGLDSFRQQVSGQPTKVPIVRI